MQQGIVDTLEALQQKDMSKLDACNAYVYVVSFERTVLTWAVITHERICSCNSLSKVYATSFCTCSLQLVEAQDFNRLGQPGLDGWVEGSPVSASEMDPTLTISEICTTED